MSNEPSKGVPGVCLKLAEAQRIVRPPAKRGRAPEKMGSYQYRTVDDVVAASKAAFHAVNLLLHVVTENTQVTGQGIIVDLKIVLIDLDDGSMVDQTVSGLATQVTGQGIGIAHSYALKQGLTQLLLLPAGPKADAEAYVDTGKRAQPAPAKAPWDAARWRSEATARGIDLAFLQAECGIELAAWEDAVNLPAADRARVGRWMLEQ
jgi:hypothetical protein